MRLHPVVRRTIDVVICVASVMCAGSFAVAMGLYLLADSTREADSTHPYKAYHHGGGISYVGNTSGTVMDDAWLVMAVSFGVAFALAMLFGERKREESA